MSSYLLNGSTPVELEIINFDEDEPYDHEQVGNVDMAAPTSPVRGLSTAPLDTPLTGGIPGTNAHLSSVTHGMTAKERMALFAANGKNNNAHRSNSSSAVGLGSGEDVDDFLGEPPDQTPLSGLMGMTSSDRHSSQSESLRHGANLAPPHEVAVAPLAKEWNCVETSTVVWEESASDELVQVNEYHVVKGLGDGSFGRVYVVCFSV